MTPDQLKAWMDAIPPNSSSFKLTLPGGTTIEITFAGPRAIAVVDVDDREPPDDGSIRRQAAPLYTEPPPPPPLEIPEGLRDMFPQLTASLQREHEKGK